MRSFEVEVRGHRYRGAWLLLDDKRIEVRSDYGRQSAYLDGKQPEQVARELLAAMAPRPL